MPPTIVPNAALAHYYPVAGAGADGSVTLGQDKLAGRGRIAVSARELSAVQQQRRATLGVRATTIVTVLASALRLAGIAPKDRDQFTLLRASGSVERYAVVSAATLTGGISGSVDLYTLEALLLPGGPEVSGD